MGVLQDGGWEPDATRDQYEYDTLDDRVVDAADATYPAERGRYRRYISRACPWTHRAALVRRVLGLEDAIPVERVCLRRQIHDHSS